MPSSRNNLQSLIFALLDVSVPPWILQLPARNLSPYLISCSMCGKEMTIPLLNTVGNQEASLFPESKAGTMKFSRHSAPSGGHYSNCNTRIHTTFISQCLGKQATQCELALGTSVQFSRSVVSKSLQPHGLQHARLPCPSPTPETYSNSCPLNWWCHPTILSSVVPFSPHLQSFPASRYLPMSQFFTSGGQSNEVSASTLVLPRNIQDLFLLGWTDWISLQSKGHSRVFSNTTVQKHWFFGTQLSLQSNSHIYTWLMEKP